MFHVFLYRSMYHSSNATFVAYIYFKYLNHITLEALISIIIWTHPSLKELTHIKYHRG